MPCIFLNRNITFDICDFLSSIRADLILILLQIMFVPVLTSIILTLLNKNHDDVKWFILNTSILNLIVGIAWELDIFIQEFSMIILLTQNIGKEIAQYSIFLLAFSRVFILHNPDLYKKVFSKTTRFLFILGYDVILTVLSYLCYTKEWSWKIIICLNAFMLVGTFGCSISILIQIRSMLKLFEHNSQLNTFKDLRRAAFVCLCQVCTYAIYTFFFIYLRLYNAGILPISYFDDNKYAFLHVLLSIIADILEPIYLLFMILDSFIPMILLRSYRKTIRKVWKKSYRAIKKIIGHPVSSLKATSN